MNYSIKTTTKYILSLSLVAFLAACGVDGNTGENTIDTGASQLVSAVEIETVPATTMLAVIQANIDANTTNAFEYKAVKITYNTVGQDGKPIEASGLLTIPTPTAAYVAYREATGQTPFSVSMICENHGTIFLNSEAPSNIEVANGLPDYATAVLMTGLAGFASIDPDYIGFGDSSNTVHPYILKKSSARASLDMLKASMKYMEDNGVVLNYQLYISGYSEGGYVAMALAQQVESELSTVNVMGVAAMAGPYNVEDLGNVELNATKVMAYPAFLADLAYSYSTYYDDINISEIAVPTLGAFQYAFNGENDTVPIHIILGVGAIDANGTVTDYGFYTHQTDELFQANFISDYTNNVNDPMRNRFAENNLDNWTPKSKINFIQCLEDDIIPFSESNNTYNKMKANGADVTLTGIPTFYLSQQQDATHPFIHANCGPTAYGAAVTWFNAIRNGDI